MGILTFSLIFIKKLTETDSPVTISLYAGVGMIPATFVAAYPYLIMPNLYQFLIIFNHFLRFFLNCQKARGPQKI